MLNLAVFYTLIPLAILPTENQWAAVVSIVQKNTPLYSLLETETVGACGEGAPETVDESCR